MKLRSKTVPLVSVLAGAAVLSTNPRQAGAAYVATVTQVGNDVDIVGTGSILTNLLDPGTTNQFTPNLIFPQFAILYVGPAANADEYYGATGPVSFGPGSGMMPDIPTSATGDPVAIFGGASEVDVPAGYVSGTPLSGSDTFSNTTISALGMTPGTYVYTLGSGPITDTYTLNIIDPTAVPEPASVGLLSIAAASTLRRRQR